MVSHQVTMIPIVESATSEVLAQASEIIEHATNMPSETVLSSLWTTGAPRRMEDFLEEVEETGELPPTFWEEIEEVKEGVDEDRAIW